MPSGAVPSAATSCTAPTRYHPAVLTKTSNTGHDDHRQRARDGPDREADARQRAVRLLDGLLERAATDNAEGDPLFSVERKC